MANVNDGDIIEVRFRYEQQNQRLMNVFHYQADITGDPIEYGTSMDYLLTQLETDADLWPTVWANVASEDCRIVRMDAQVIHPTRLYHVSKTVSIPGETTQAASPALPQNVQLSLTKVSVETGRGRTGRVEIPGSHIDLVNPSSLSAAGIAWVTALGDSMKLAVDIEMVTGNQMVPVILNAFAPAGSPLIVTYRVQETVRVARRRTVGVGE